jgi:hypothetical protein
MTEDVFPFRIDHDLTDSLGISIVRAPITRAFDSGVSGYDQVFAIEWDQDRDTRIFSVLRSMFYGGMLEGVIFVGESKAHMKVLIDPREVSEDSSKFRQQYLRTLTNIADVSVEDDSWTAEVIFELDARHAAIAAVFKLGSHDSETMDLHGRPTGAPISAAYFDQSEVVAQKPRSELARAGEATIAGALELSARAQSGASIRSALDQAERKRKSREVVARFEPEIGDSPQNPRRRR